MLENYGLVISEPVDESEVDYLEAITNQGEKPLIDEE